MDTTPSKQQKTATFLRPVSEGLNSGDGALYRVSHKYLGSDYVVSSRITQDYRGRDRLETALFPATADGAVDVDGLFLATLSGTLEHEVVAVPEISDAAAFARAGYEVLTTD